MQEMESLKQQLGDAQRVIVEKLARAPSEQELGQLKAAVDKLKVGKAGVQMGMSPESAGWGPLGHFDWGWKYIGVDYPWASSKWGRPRARVRALRQRVRPTGTPAVASTAAACHGMAGWRSYGAMRCCGALIGIELPYCVRNPRKTRLNWSRLAAKIVTPRGLATVPFCLPSSAN